MSSCCSSVTKGRRLLNFSVTRPNVSARLAAVEARLAGADASLACRAGEDREAIAASDSPLATINDDDGFTSTPAGRNAQRAVIPTTLRTSQIPLRTFALRNWTSGFDDVKRSFGFRRRTARFKVGTIAARGVSNGATRQMAGGRLA